MTDVFNQEKYKFLTNLPSERIVDIISSFQEKGENGFVMLDYVIYNLPKTNPPLENLIQLFDHSFTEDHNGFPLVYVQPEELIAYLPLRAKSFGLINSYKSVYNYWLVNIARDPSGKSNTSLHATLLIFDNVNRLIYYFDPNGKLTGYNVNAVDRLWSLYFSDLDYFYVNTMKWRNKIALNYHVTSQINDTGNCLSWCLLLIKMMTEEKITPKEAYDTLSFMTNHERGALIYDYNNKLYSLLNN